MSDYTIHVSDSWLEEGRRAVCHCCLCYMLDRSHDVAGALVVEMPWQELAVAAGVALW